MIKIFLQPPRIVHLTQTETMRQNSRACQSHLLLNLKLDECTLEAKKDHSIMGESLRMELTQESMSSEMQKERDQDWRRSCTAHN